MKSVYFPLVSFKNINENKRINELFLEYGHTLYEEIDGNVQISIFGNRDLNLINQISRYDNVEMNIIDPSDQLPIEGHNDLTYIAIVYYKDSDNPKASGRIIYGNVDYKLHEFISLLLYRLACKFPKSPTTKCTGYDPTKENEMRENF